MAGLQQIPDAEVLQAMRSLPASRLPLEVRTELAMILDPPKTCPNRDYRFFAENLGVQTAEWEYLDAQKCAAETSSTRLIIKYLIDKRGDLFTIFHIYEALKRMELNGPMIIVNYVRRNWRSLGLDTGPGQQNQEAPGCACQQCIQGIRQPTTTPNPPSQQSQYPPCCRNMNSPPPSYEEAVDPNKSLADCHGESACVHGQDQFCGNCFNQDPEQWEMERKSQQIYVQYSSVCEGEGLTYLPQHPMQHTGHSPQSAGQIHNGLSKATSVKQSMDAGPHSTNSMVSRPDPADRNHHITKQFVFEFNITLPYGKDPAQERVKYGQPKSRGKTGKKQLKTGDPGHSPRKPDVIIRQTVQNHQEHFVLILAGDIRLEKELSNQVRDLARTLQKYQIPYVIVTSASEQPIAWLTEAQCRTLPALQSNKSSVSGFVTDCYKKAKKILIAVSPGYVLYADEYVHGAQRTESTMQEIIRRLHEQMKRERSCSSTHRLWPLLLHQLRTDRTHIPNFLSSVQVYWFGRKNVKNFAVVLQHELQVDAHQN